MKFNTGIHIQDKVIKNRRIILQEYMKTTLLYDILGLLSSYLYYVTQSSYYLFFFLINIK